MKHFSGYGAYLLFLALRTHFNNVKYDFFQMKGKVKATKDSFSKRNDKLFFEKLAKLYDAEELKNFYISNFLEDRNYITDMLSEEAHGTFYDSEKRRQAITYIFKNDMEVLFDGDFKSIFRSVNDEYPLLIGLILRRDISMESAVILNDFVPYATKFDKYLGSDDIIWSRVALKLRKYKPFVKYDSKKIRMILKEKINESFGGKGI